MCTSTTCAAADHCYRSPNSGMIPDETMQGWMAFQPELADACEGYLPVVMDAGGRASHGVSAIDVLRGNATLDEVYVADEPEPPTLLGMAGCLTWLEAVKHLLTSLPHDRRRSAEEAGLLTAPPVERIRIAGAFFNVAMRDRDLCPASAPVRQI
jgi:hypothetical protein